MMQQRIPGPRPAPLIGGTGNIFRYLSDPIGYTSRLFKAHGAVVALAAGEPTNLFSPHGSPGTIFVYGPELSRQARTPHERWLTQPLTGLIYPLGQAPGRQQPLKHFLTEPWGLAGEEHRRQRRIVMPALHHQRLAAYRDEMVAITDSALGRWSAGDVVDVNRELRTLTSRIATKILFGEDDPERSGGAGQLVQDALATLSRPATSLLPLDLPGLPYRRFLDLATRYEAQMRAIIARKRATGADDGDVLSTLIQAHDEETGAALDADQLLSWVGSLFAAGHETSGLALCWTLLLLSQHPTIAADLVDELEQALGGDAPTVAQLGALPLLDAVIKESMRLLPPVPFVWRTAEQPLEIGGYMVPRGTEVYASIYHTHHMPELYAEPERFSPRRWEALDPGPYEYLPFSAGPRMCIGAAFAMMELKIVLAMLLQRFRMQFVPRVRVDRYGIVTLGPRRGLPMQVHRQDRAFSQGVGGVRGNVREMVLLP